MHSTAPADWAITFLVSHVVNLGPADKEREQKRVFVVCEQFLVIDRILSREYSLNGAQRYGT